MKRDIEKTLQQYEEKYSGTTGGLYTITVDDLKHVLLKSKCDRQYVVQAFPLDLIYNGMKIGYMIGYNRAKRERSIKK